MALHTEVFSDTGQLLSGVYTETVWGLAPHPLAMVGEFTLLRHSYRAPIVPRLYLPIVCKQWFAPQSR